MAGWKAKRNRVWEVQLIVRQVDQIMRRCYDCYAIAHFF